MISISYYVMVKKKRIEFLLLLLSIIFFQTAGFSQKLDLQDAISIALKNSLDLQVLKNNVEITNINNHIGVAGGLPIVTGTLSDNEQASNITQKLNTGTILKRNGASGNTFNSGINSSILLYNGSRVVTTKKRLEQLQAQSEQYLNSQIQNIAAAVMTAYYDVIRQQDYMKTIAHSIDASQKRLEIVKTQQNVGMANNADLFQSQLDLNALFQSKQSQQSIIDQAKTELLLLLNLKPDSAIVVSDTILVDKNVILGDILNGLQNNADIAAASDQVKINELISKETAALRYPSIRANAAYNYNRAQISGGQILLNQNNGVSGGINLSIPIYNGSIYKRQQRVADINTKNASLQKDILIKNYNANVVKTYQSYAAGLQQLETQQKNVELAGKLLDLVLLRFQLHAATILEVKQAQKSFEDASFTMTNLSYAAKSSEIELKRLANQIKF
ncbi:MAG TPA: TolC family protein [Chitinophagaceae bacterium]|nr:TolC family protein [Chitinophagaceae bacterium]